MFAYKGKLVVVEAKVHKKHTAWPLNSVKDHQIEGLISILDNGFEAYVMLNVRYGLGNSRFNKVFLFDPEVIKQISQQRNSIPVNDLHLFSTVIYHKRVDKISKGKISIWDIESYLSLNFQ